MATTKAQLRELVQHVNRTHNLNLSLTAWAPGDGWTRYKLVIIEEATGAEWEPFGSRAYTASEMLAALTHLLYLPDAAHMSRHTP